MSDITTPPREVAFRKFLGDERVNILAQDAQQTAAKVGVSMITLSTVDLASLRNYTGLTPASDKRNYQMINDALRSGNEKELERLAPVIETLKSALSKLPSYVGDVVRATDLPESVAKDIVPGGVYSDAGFMSTAIGKTDFKGKYMFSIKSRTGKHIAPFSFYPDQNEVLYHPGTEFTIEAVWQLADGTIEVDLKEK
ncbi:MAG: ADP-ribosyltransferase [Magnetococcus sp. DMHC-1]